MADKRCDWVRQELAEARRGRSSAEVADKVEAHLAGCAACRAEAAWDGRLAGLLGTASDTGNLEGRVAGLVRRRRWLRGTAVGVAAAAVLGVASLAWFESQRFLPVPTRPELVQRPSDAVVMKELAGVVNVSPVVRLSVDRQQDLLLAELELLAKGEKQ